MLRSTDRLKGYVLQARDGEIGRCRDFLFDDEQWTVRYMVADTGKWIPDRKVLISPLFLGEPAWDSRRFPVDLTKEQIEEAPTIEEDAPISRQQETHLLRYFGYPYYWVGEGIWGMQATPGDFLKAPPGGISEPQPDPEGDPHLRSVSEVTGYSIAAQDGDIGHVEEFVVDDGSWTMRYMVVDTRNWLPGRKVLISPSWVKEFAWAEGNVGVELTKQQVKDSPEYDPRSPLNRDYEVRLHDYYGRPVYWE